MVAGLVSPEQADAIVTAVDLLPGNPALRSQAEEVLVEQAASLDASELARAGRHLVTVVDPDGTERRLEAALEREERAAHADRYLAITDDGAGGVRLKGRGSIEDGALLRTALLPLTCPAPAVDEHDGTPLSTTRATTVPGRWDGLVRLAQHALDTDAVPDSHATPARLLITLDHQIAPVRA